MSIVCRGIRGATTTEGNSKEAIFDATKELLRDMVDKNHIETPNVAAAFFTTTTDLNAAFPAAAAREMGWGSVPLMCSHEMQVPNALEQCIRIMILLNTDKSQEEISHSYLRKAINLRSA